MEMAKMKKKALQSFVIIFLAILMVFPTHFNEFPVAAAAEEDQSRLTGEHDPFFNPETLASSVASKRLSGDDRYMTAIEISKDSYPQSKSAEAVVVARGDAFADALPGGVLAYQEKGPLLLTRPESLPPEVGVEITRVLQNNGTIFILGGPAAISASVENQLKALGNYNTERIAGSNREETAFKMAQKVGAASQEAIVVYAYNFPDALAISSYAARSGTPILLSGSKSLSQYAQNFISANNINQVYVTGGTAVISEQVFTSLEGLVGQGNVKRLGGADRYQTARLIADEFFSSPDTVTVAYGRGFPDALAGGVNAAGYNAPILLVEKEYIHPPMQQYITGNKDSVETLVLYGGPAVVSELVNGWVLSLFELALEPGYESKDLYHDTIELAEYIADIQMLKIDFVKAISNDFTSDELVPLEEIDYQEYAEDFFDTLTKLQEKSDDIDEVIARLENAQLQAQAHAVALNSAGSLHPGGSDLVLNAADPEQQFLGITLGTLVVCGAFALYTRRSAINSQNKVVEVVNQMTPAQQEQAFQDARGTRIGYHIEETNASEFWENFADGKYRNQAAVLHNELVTFNHDYEDIARGEAGGNHPIGNRLCEEGVEGIEKGTKVVLAGAKGVNSSLGKGIEYAEKGVKFAGYVEKTLDGDVGGAVKDYVKDQVSDLVDDATLSGASSSLELLADVICEEDPTKFQPADTGVVKVIDSDEEGEPASLVVAVQVVDDPDHDPEEDPPVTVISDMIAGADPDDPDEPEEEELIIVLPEGEWELNVIDEDGDTDSTPVDVTPGTDMVVNVDTSPPSEFYLSRSVINQTDDSTEYRVTAHISNLETPTSLSISVQEAITGESTKILYQSGSVSWNVTVLKKDGSATVTRNDTNAKQSISLPAQPAKEYSLSLWASPASPPAGVGVTVYARISPADAGVQINFVVSGTDGYSQNRNVLTNAEGIATTYIPGGGAGVRDTITATITSTGQSRTFTYTFQ